MLKFSEAKEIIGKMTQAKLLSFKFYIQSLKFSQIVYQRKKSSDNL